MKFTLIGPSEFVDFNVWPSYPYRKKIELLQTLEYSSQNEPFIYTRSKRFKITHTFRFEYLVESKLLEILDFFNSAAGANGRANIISFKHWNGQTITNCKFIPSALVYNKVNYQCYSLEFGLEERK